MRKLLCVIAALLVLGTVVASAASAAFLYGSVRNPNGAAPAANAQVRIYNRCNGAFGYTRTNYLGAWKASGANCYWGFSADAIWCDGAFQWDTGWFTVISAANDQYFDFGIMTERYWTGVYC